MPTPPQFFFNGTPATVTYAGLVSGLVGLYQFNVVVPNITASGPVPITFTLGSGPTAINSTQPLYTAIINN
jgi:uncharacterized protein (TIGR03437 family)